MNKENLNKLISNYIANFDYINNDVNMEYYKWEAVKHFQEHWDIDAPDFAAMFKESVKETYNLINNRIVQPTNGIVKLAEHPSLTETIRQMFRDLLVEDNGDINKRQDKIYAFLEKADELLNTYYKGSWKYAQDMRTVIFYLCLLEPHKNYMFKATQAKEFMYCVEYGRDFGSGESFNLKNYYDMCDELVAAIKETPELVQLHNGRITDKMWADDDYHILAYDIIYSGIVYNLYNNITIVKPTRSNAQTRERQLQTKREELSAVFEHTCTELNETLQERANYDEFSAKGLEVTHKAFGEGIVVAHNGNMLKVRFGEEEKQFQMPQGFSNGFLKTESTEIMEMFNEIASLDDKISSLKSSQTVIKHQLEILK